MFWGANLSYDCFGLAHYRRHFCYKRKGSAKESILTHFEAERLFSSADIIVPKRRMYYIETLESHFNHMRLSTDDDLKILKEAVRKVSPQYVNACDVVFHRTWGHMFYMFIMRREVFQDYYKWFFAVLSEVERNINMSSSIHPNRKSIIGYVAEFLLVYTWKQIFCHIRKLILFFLRSRTN